MSKRRCFLDVDATSYIYTRIICIHFELSLCFLFDTENIYGYNNILSQNKQNKIPPVHQGSYSRISCISGVVNTINACTKTDNTQNIQHEAEQAKKKKSMRLKRDHNVLMVCHPYFLFGCFCLCWGVQFSSSFASISMWCRYACWLAGVSEKKVHSARTWRYDVEQHRHFYRFYSLML